jgi:multiple sugar transport system substrate-binding protein
MNSNDSSGKGLTRRQLVQTMGTIGAGMFLSGCATTVKEAPAAKPATNAPAPTTSQPANLKLAGWNFQPEQVRTVLDRYEKAHAGVKVEFTAHASAQYNEKMLALFLSNTTLDVVYGRDGSWPAWADAKYIQPVDDLPGLAELTRYMIPFTLAGLKYKNKTWGLPYYGDFMSFGYDADLLTKAGVKEAPTTWAQLKEACLAIKGAGLLQTPLMLAMGPSASLHWWTLVYGSGGNLFDADFNPVFANGKDPVALSLLEWMVQALHEWKFMDLKSVEATTDTSRTAFAAGQFAFATAAKYDFKLLNTPDKSKISGRAKAMNVPTLASGKSGTCGWTRNYCLSSTTTNKAAAWELLKDLGSIDNAREWYLKAGIGYADKRLDRDEQVVSSTKEWGNVELFAQQSTGARLRQGINEQWFAEWESYNQQQIQNALLRKVSPKDALAESGRKLEDLKKKYKQG